MTFGEHLGVSLVTHSNIDGVILQLAYMLPADIRDAYIRALRNESNRVSRLNTLLEVDVNSYSYHIISQPFVWHRTTEGDDYWFSISIQVAEEKITLNLGKPHTLEVRRKVIL